jgi:predicted DNA-binding WGR domain protein
MPTEPVFLRWEHTDPPHRKFYEVDVELSLFYPKLLTRRWGRIGGKRPRSLRMRVADGEELRRQVAHISRRRQAHGYRLVQELQVAAIAAPAA